jgi:hypothetical protein
MEVIGTLILESDVSAGSATQKGAGADLKFNP